MTKYNYEDELKNVKKGWLQYFNPFTEHMKTVVFPKISSEPSLPLPGNLFKCFTFCEPSDIKVVILGQDPYYTVSPIYATGLAFSANKDIPYNLLPKSLLNIYKELVNSFPDINLPNHGCLDNWAEQGILLLNTSLTVKQKSPKLHMHLWKKFTDNIIASLSNDYDNIVFVLMGEHAQSKKDLIDTNKHIVLTTSHPSPLSARKGFFGSKIFESISNHCPSIKWF